MKNLIIRKINMTGSYLPLASAPLNGVWLAARNFFVTTAQKMWFGAVAAAQKSTRTLTLIRKSSTSAAGLWAQPASCGKSKARA